MKIEVTANVFHKVNPDYFIALVQFEEDDKHFFKSKSNWLPKDDELMAIMQVTMALSPTFRDKMFKYIESFKRC